MFQKVFLRTTRARRLRSGIIALCAIGAIVLVAVGASPLLALGTVTVRVDPATRAAPVNGTFTVDIVADNVDTEMNPDGLGAYEFDLVYDPSYLEVVTGGAADAGELGATGRTVTELGPNITTTIVTTMTFGAYSHPPLDANGPVSDTVALATVTLQAKRAGWATLDLENALLTDTQANVWPDGGARVLNASGAAVSVFGHADLDKDGKTDLVTYDAVSGDFTARLSGSNYAWFSLSVASNGTPALDDYDGDNATDFAVLVDGFLVARLSGSDQAWFSKQVGSPQAQHVQGDVDGDGKGEPAVIEEVSGQAWLVARLSGSSYAWFAKHIGAAGGTPVTGDFDGDGKHDPAQVVDMSGQAWLVARLSGSNYGWWAKHIGNAGGTPVTGDFDGDGKHDPAQVVDMSGQAWLVARLSGSNYGWWAKHIGDAGTQPVTADLDEDGKWEVPTFDTSTGWYTARLSASNYAWFSKQAGSPNTEPVTYARP